MVIGESIGTTDVAIIGAGPGGYSAAIRCAELGKKVTLIDRESVGGVCLHHGCIPTKALIHAAEEFHDLKKFSEFGVNIENITLDFNKTQEWKKNIVKNLDNGIRGLLKHHKIELIKANAFFETSNKLNLRPVNEEEHLEINALEFKKCIIATGSKERMIPGINVDGDKILTSTHAIEMRELPTSVLVIGGGYIGVELSQMMAKLGVKIIIVEALPSILNLLDNEFSDIVKKELELMGAEIYVDSKVESCAVEGNSVKTVVNTKQGKKEFNTDKVVVAIGRLPNTSELQLDNTKVQLDENGFIKVDDSLQTTDPRILAIGDVVGGVMLAHKAAYEAKIAAEVIAGEASVKDAVVPYAIFSDPEIAGVGATEQELKGTNYEVKKFQFSALGKAHIMQHVKGFFKVLYDKDKNILGLHIAGPRASDMIGEAVLAMEMGATVEDISLIIHPHPTLVEGYGELADSAMGTPTNSL